MCFVLSFKILNNTNLQLFIWNKKVHCICLWIFHIFKFLSISFMRSSICHTLGIDFNSLRLICSEIFQWCSADVFHYCQIQKNWNIIFIPFLKRSGNIGSWLQNFAFSIAVGFTQNKAIAAFWNLKQKVAYIKHSYMDRGTMHNRCFLNSPLIEFSDT